jgi:V/A-type H+-transporting ATPase subunit D
MPAREIIPTQSAFLELKAERAGMQEGYRFLDEKRLILAAEILATLRDFEATMARYRTAEQEALAALRAAVGRHGLEELSVYPAAEPRHCDVPRGARSVLGVHVEDLGPPPQADADAPPVPRPAAPPTNPSPEAEHCRAVFDRLLPIAGRLAILTGNLKRLHQEYIRTARRARALEDVLLPEIDDTLRAVDSALEELEREESTRAHRSGFAKA